MKSTTILIIGTFLKIIGFIWIIFWGLSFVILLVTQSSKSYSIIALAASIIGLIPFFIFHNIRKNDTEVYITNNILNESDKKFKDFIGNNINDSNFRFSAADELARFKKLLDDGTITQEEFDIKKKELLDI